MEGTMKDFTNEDNDIDELTTIVIGRAFKVHSTLGSGFLESVYMNALLYELADSGLTVEPEAALSVIYEGEIVGRFFADLIVDRRLIVELKAVERLSLIHEVQLVNYLKATGIQDGLLINFGSSKVEVKRKFRSKKLL